MKLKRATIPTCFALLIAASGLVLYGSLRIAKPKFSERVSTLLPLSPAGWSAKDRPIAESEELKQAVNELLNFDDAVFVDYVAHTGERISIYIAYWTPGKMPHRLVATHTPDVCWVAAGWKKEAEAKVTNLISPSGMMIPSGESRIFSANGAPEHVWFWHLVGDESKSYGTGSNPPWHAALFDLFRKGLNQREEQFFIRLSSNRPLSTFQHGEIIPHLFAKIPWPETKPTREP